MRLGRLDIGLWKYPRKSIRNYVTFGYDKGLCGCHLFTFGIVCVTWFGDECLEQEKKGENKN
jgi:hypothetical protein